MDEKASELFLLSFISASDSRAAARGAWIIACLLSGPDRREMMMSHPAIRELQENLFWTMHNFAENRNVDRDVI
jgi:hypothetical protein